MGQNTAFALIFVMVNVTLLLSLFTQNQLPWWVTSYQGLLILMLFVFNLLILAAGFARR